ncbi:MAG TPA: YSC84-related protein [bacterium]|nr:YSC84-related protein [bacterium]
MRKFDMFRPAMLFIMAAVLAVSMAGAREVFAASAQEIDRSVDETIAQFEAITGAKEVIKNAKGILVFPVVFKGGFVFGGEYGEGALRVAGKTAGYYNTAAASFGFQLGGQKKTIILAFMRQEALDSFRNSSGWKVGVDASVAVIAVGAGGAIDSANINQPIVAFIFDQKGLMYNLTLEGAKITKMAR